eukprot:CAMPEP_0202915556 /NCGR_PEP_ID=MMETSP1392-20130828/65985_1 /ASSEMBLY_ACC=CAM_ASM_000868 /TAXON_ID=225041 /ORGANISM="Chlamydomonas chlamydogama, Strain SAG 11-48b" /LENGTH=107 /DNA_ID=CAMNT_0049607633 /DNA_START=33 /DNA_END=356 /DNA_ORIENTATION=-
MPHSDYPSLTACLCGTFAEYNALFIKSDIFDYQVIFPQGCSSREPGITPVFDLTVHLKTKKNFLDGCGYSRLYGGVHFKKSVDAAIKLCAPIGVMGYNHAMKLMRGD